MRTLNYRETYDFFVRMFSNPDMMQQVLDTVGSVLYERLKKNKPEKNILEPTGAKSV